MQRRSFLQTLAFASLGSSHLLQANNEGLAQQGASSQAQWQNWSANQACQYREMLLPQNTEHLAALIKHATKRIRPVGASHSFSPLVPTSSPADDLLSLALMQNIEVNGADKNARLGGGVQLARLGEQFWEQGLAMENMPDIDLQTIAGAIATSTHGTGARLGSLSTQINALELVDGNARQHRFTRDDEAFYAAGCQLGSLGVVSEVELNLRDKYHLQERSWMMPIDEAFAQAEALKNGHRHFEFFALPHADYMLAVTLDEVAAQAPVAGSEEDAYATFKTFSQIVEKLPWMKSLLINLAAKTVQEETRLDRSFKIFSNMRDIRFNEMEYALASDDGLACLQEILQFIKQNDVDVVFPIEYRYVAKDDFWLSPFYEQDSATISIHQFFDKSYIPYFSQIEAIFKRYNGRPHWGKWHTQSADTLAKLYPRYNDFKLLRKSFDSKGKLLNSHLEALFV